MLLAKDGAQGLDISRGNLGSEKKGVGVKGGMLQRHKEATSVVNHRSVL